MSSLHGGDGCSGQELHAVFVRLPRVHVVLAPHQGEPERAVSGVPRAVQGGPARLRGD